MVVRLRAAGCGLLNPLPSRASGNGVAEALEATSFFSSPAEVDLRVVGHFSNQSPVTNHEC